jgi:hypothetical protein
MEPLVVKIFHLYFFICSGHDTVRAGRRRRPREAEVSAQLGKVPGQLLQVHPLAAQEVGRRAGAVPGLQAGLAIKNPPKKTQKTHLKKPTKMFFLGFF